MKGRDIIKMIIDENGLDKDYSLNDSDSKESKRKKKYKTLDEMCSVYVQGDIIFLEVADPIQAMPFGLSDQYEKYGWDGSTVYCYTDRNGKASWSFSFGGGSSTLVAESVNRYRETAMDTMARFAENDNIDLPKNLSRLHFYKKTN